MTEELRRRGWVVNHKRVYRLMREDNLLCLRRRKFVVTTNSDHGLPLLRQPGHRLQQQERSVQSKSSERQTVS